MAPRKKLIFVCNTSWSVYKFRLPLLRLLAGRGHKIYVLAPEDRHSEWIRKEKSVVFIPLYHFKATRFSPLADLSLYRELRRHYRQIGPDLIFHYTIKANIYGTLAAAKTAPASISVITGLGYTFLNNGLMRKAVSFMYKHSLKKAREVWFLNKDDQAYFVEKKITPAHKTFVLPGEGVDTDLFREQMGLRDTLKREGKKGAPPFEQQMDAPHMPKHEEATDINLFKQQAEAQHPPKNEEATDAESLRQQAKAQDDSGEEDGTGSISFGAASYAIPKQPLNFLLIARIIKEKGIEEYARAAAILKQKGCSATCRIIGYYDHKNPSAIPFKKFSEWVNSGTIVYPGATDDVLAFIEKADCIVLPSYREGLPLSLLEGASMSKPLIAANTAGCREIVEQGRNGFLVPVKDADKLAEAMETFYHLSPADRMALGAEARKTVTERFSMEKVHALYLSRIATYIQEPAAGKVIPIVNKTL
ncbi:MAG: glycosyltransferase family 4 protein [Chitinophagaceae bacterium]|nr:glycosyltransferase family 4 protein [Chitinophagaceae bacterium]